MERSRHHAAGCARLGQFAHLSSQNGLTAPFYDTIKKNLSGLANRFQFCH
jgi:hypothetical protein